MSRRCTCSRLLAALHADPRLRTLPLAARALWLLLAEAMLQGEAPGVLPFGSLARVSLLVSAPETDIETHLETLLAEGLLTRTPDGGLACPLLVQAAARTAAARANGAAGGRPRKGETPEQARARRAQGALLLPVPGRAAETQETKPETRAAETPTTTESSISESSSPPPLPVRAWAAVGSQVAMRAGLDPVRQRFDYAPVREWMEAGASAELILAAVEECVARPSYVAGRVHSLRYFDRAVRERLQAASGQTSPAAPAGYVPPPPSDDYTLAIRRWREDGMQGPPPRRSAA